MRRYTWSAFLLGFLLQFNLVPLAWHIPVGRITELAMLPCVGFLIHHLTSRANNIPTLIYCAAMAALTALHLASVGSSLAFGNSNIDLSASVNYFLYLIGGVGLYVILMQRSATTCFCWGIVIGAALSLIAFVMEANGLTNLAISLGLTQPVQLIQVDNQVNREAFRRLTGMWGHANEVGHIIAMSVPAAGYLYLTRRDRIPIVLAGLALAGCFFFTINRGGIIASFATILATIAARKEMPERKGRYLLVVLVCMLLVALALYLLPVPKFIYSRFTDEGSIHTNASGRVETTLAGFWLAITHPLGLGWLDWRGQLEQSTGFRTPHNGFIAQMYEIGVPFTLMYVGAIGAVIYAGFRRSRVFSLDIYLMLAAVQGSVSFMFEEINFSDPFLMLTGLIMARAYSGAVDVAGRKRIGAPARGHPEAALQALTREISNRGG